MNACLHDVLLSDSCAECEREDHAKALLEHSGGWPILLARNLAKQVLGLLGRLSALRTVHQDAVARLEGLFERERASRRAAEGVAAIAKKELEKAQAEIAAQKNDLADLELERQKAVAESASRFDCHRGPGTTEPGCGGCVSCLLRLEEGMAAKVVRAEKERDAAIARLRETDLLRRESIAEAQSLRARLAELTPQPPKEP